MKLKNLLPLIGAVLILSASSGCGRAGMTGSDSKHSWKIASKTEAIFSRNTGGFTNKKQGIIVGDGGEIHYTKNGGKTWDRGNNTSLCLFGLNIINDNVAYACGNGSIVVKTTDGGANWKNVSTFGEYEPNHPRYLSFINEDTGWIATPNKSEYYGDKVMLGSTRDGGKTWDNILLPDEIGQIVAIYLRTPENGYVLDTKKNIYITKDGGKSFIKQALNIDDAILNAKTVQQVVLRFLDENNAFIAYQNIDAKFRAARSSDGGKTWINDTVPDLENGSLNLSQDGKLLTLMNLGEPIKILEYK